MIPKEQQPITLPLLQQKVRGVRKDLTSLQNDIKEFGIHIQELFEDSKKRLENVKKNVD
jgi:hypothetical protein